MGIPIGHIKQGCCDNDLSAFTIIDMDELDDVGSTCDKVIECRDKYYLVEEKSILLSFFHSCCDELNIDFDVEYKYVEEGITYLKIDEVMALVQTINIEVKKRILSDTIVNLTNTSAKKASNTTDILNKQFDSTKTSNMPIFYLYCKSGYAVDMLINSLLFRYKKSMFIECQFLKAKLEESCLDEVVN